MTIIIIIIRHTQYPRIYSFLPLILLFFVLRTRHILHSRINPMDEQINWRIYFSFAISYFRIFLYTLYGY